MLPSLGGGGASLTTGSHQQVNLGCRPTVEDVSKLHPDFGRLIEDLDKRFRGDTEKLQKLKEQCKQVTELNNGLKSTLKLKSSDASYLGRSTRVAEDTMDIVETSMDRLQRIVDCLSNDFSRVDHGMIVSTQVEHMEYLDDLNQKCDLLDSRVAELYERFHLATSDESRLHQYLTDKLNQFALMRDSEART